MNITNYKNYFKHPISNKNLQQAKEKNFLNFALIQNDKMEQKNILALILNTKDKKDLPEYLQKAKEKAVFNNNTEHWIKTTSKTYIENMDFENYGIPFLLFKKNKENIKFIKKYDIDIDKERSIYPPLIFNLLVDDNVNAEILDYFLTEGRPDLNKQTAANGNIIDLLSLNIKLAQNREKFSQIIAIIHKKKELQPSISLDFFKNIFLLSGIKTLNKIKENNINYQQILGKQEMGILLSEVVAKVGNDKEVEQLLLDNKHHIDIDFNTRKAIAEHKPDLFKLIIDKKEEFDLEYEHFKDFIFYLEYSLSSSQTSYNPNYTKNIKKSLDIVLSFTQNQELKKQLNPIKLKTQKKVL